MPARCVTWLCFTSVNDAPLSAQLCQSEESTPHLCTTYTILKYETKKILRSDQDDTMMIVILSEAKDLIYLN